MCVFRSVLTVACEQTEVLLFDPISSRHIKTLVEAHEDCVNNIRYISSSAPAPFMCLKYQDYIETDLNLIPEKQVRDAFLHATCHIMPHQNPSKKLMQSYVVLNT